MPAGRRPWARSPPAHRRGAAPAFPYRARSLRTDRARSPTPSRVRSTLAHSRRKKSDDRKEKGKARRAVRKALVQAVWHPACVSHWWAVRAHRRLNKEVDTMGTTGKVLSLIACMTAATLASAAAEAEKAWPT